MTHHDETPAKLPQATKSPFTVRRPILAGLLSGVALAGFFTVAAPRPPQFAAASTAFIILFAAPSVAGLFVWSTKSRALAALITFSLLAYGYEFLSIRTGFPYGRFTYSPAIGALIAGTVPWTVPAAWLPLLLGAAARFRNPLKAGLFLILIDALLDPLAVRLGFWRYAEPGAYFGVPLTNFIGWLLTGTFSAWLLRRIIGTGNSAPAGTSLSLLLILTFWTAAAVTAGAVVPAAAGAAALAVLYRGR